MSKRRYANLEEAEKHGLSGVLAFAAQEPNPRPDSILLEAMREVDALTPSCPPISPADAIARRGSEGK